MHIRQAGICTKIVVIVVLTYLVGSLLTVVGQIQDAQAVGYDLQKQVDKVREENDKMSNALEHKDDPEMVEQVARERGYIKVGETLFLDTAG